MFIQRQAALLAALLLFSSLAQAREPSFDWSARDKQAHAGVSTLLSAGIYQQTKSYGVAFGSCLGIGLAKEIADHTSDGQFSWNDMGANAIGCGTGLVLGRVLFGSSNGLQFRF